HPRRAAPPWRSPVRSQAGSCFGPRIHGRSSAGARRCIYHGPARYQRAGCGIAPRGFCRRWRGIPRRGCRMSDIVRAMDDPNLFASWFPGASWNGWRCVLKDAYALPMMDAELTFFRTVADRAPPDRRVKELWVIAGRRAGKDSVASLIGAFTAALFDGGNVLRP